MIKMPQPRWELTTTLYRKTNGEVAGILVGYVVRPGNAVTYLVAWAEDGESEHWECELTEERVL